MTLWFIAGFILLSVFVVYFTSRLVTWSLVMLTYFLSMYYLVDSQINHVVFDICVISFIIISVFCNTKQLRRLLTKIIFIKAKNILPKISETEKLALDAGDSWFEQEVFRGNPDFVKLHGLKKFSLNAEEKSFYDNETEQLCSMLDEWHITSVDKDLPVVVWDFLRKNKFFGLVIAKEYGGLGFSAAAHSDIVMKIATRSTSAAVTVMVPNSLGPGELLYHYGTDAQKNYYLPRLASGEEIPCFALTGPTAGSDATSIPDEGIVCYGEHEGKTVLGIKLQHVDKRYITLAPIATCVGLAFKLKDPENLLHGVGREGITCALLPHTHPGLEIGNRLQPLDIAFMNGTVKIKESFIPMDWVIGGQAMTGEGWRMLVECLSIGRSISLPACGTAGALFSTVMTSAYAMVREQFKVAIGHFEGIEEIIAKMGGVAYMLNATRQFTVSAVDAGIRPSVASAIAKYHLTEGGRTAIIQAMDVHAGRGIIMGPNNYLARGYQGAPIGITVEGANIMTRNLMIFGQGAMRCHPYIRDEYESLMDTNGLNKFDDVIFRHIGYSIQVKIRSVFNSFTGGIFARGYASSKFNSYYKQITRLSSNFAYLSDLSLILLGGDIKRKERISARLGDAMSFLYMACASLKYYEDNGKRDSDEIFLTWVLEHCLYQTQEALVGVLDNYPLPKLARVIQFLLFPYGKIYKAPSDKLEHDMSVSLLNDSMMRTVFKSMCYVPLNINDPVGRMEVAYQAVLAVEPIRTKIRVAIKANKLPNAPYRITIPRAVGSGVITQDEANELQQALQYTNDVIQVDEFKPFDLGVKNAHPDWR